MFSNLVRQLIGTVEEVRMVLSFCLCVFLVIYNFSFCKKTLAIVRLNTSSFFPLTMIYRRRRQIAKKDYRYVRINDNR